MKNKLLVFILFFGLITASVASADVLSENLTSDQNNFVLSGGSLWIQKVSLAQTSQIQGASIQLSHLASFDTATGTIKAYIASESLETLYGGSNSVEWELDYNETQLIDIPFTTVQPILPSGNYWIVFEQETSPQSYISHKCAPSDSGNIQRLSGYANVSDQPDLSLWTEDIGGNTCAFGLTYGSNLTYKLEGTLNTSTTISIISPVNGTSTLDFSHFSISYNLGTSTVGAINYACIEYLAGFETTHHTDCENIGTGTSSSFDFEITKTIPYSYLGEIHARATLRGNIYSDLYNYSTVYYATSSEISWTNIGEDTSGFYEPPTSTSTVANASIDCSGNGIVGDSICYVLKFLFVPAPTVLNAWSGLWETIKLKPPIGYFTIFSNEISGLTSTTTPAYAMADISSIPFFEDLKTGIGALLSLVMTFYVVHRFKTIKI